MRYYTRSDGKTVLVIQDGVELVFDTPEQAILAARRQQFVIRVRTLDSQLIRVAQEIADLQRDYAAGYAPGQPYALSAADLTIHGLTTTLAGAALTNMVAVATDVLGPRLAALFPLTDR